MNGCGRGKVKQPYCFEIGEEQLFACAGLGSLEGPERRQGKGLIDPHHDAKAVTAAVHDRMPVVLDPDDYDLWLDPRMTNVAAASEPLKRFDARLMRLRSRRQLSSERRSRMQCACGTR